MQRTYNELEMQTIQQAEQGGEIPGPVRGSIVSQLRHIDSGLNRLWEAVSAGTATAEDLKPHVGRLARELIILCANKDIGLIECLQAAHDKIENDKKEPNALR